MFDDFTKDELLVLVEVLHQSIDGQLQIVCEYISEEEAGIKCNLVVQSIVCTMFTELTSNIRLLQKLAENKLLKLSSSDLDPTIRDFKDYLSELNTVVYKIQTRTDAYKSDSD